MSKNLRNFANKKVLAFLVVAVIILALVSSSISLSTSSYTSAFEGAKARFIGIRDLTTDKVYTNTQKHDATTAWFDTKLSFDIDDAKTGMCNLAGGMTSVYIPQSTVTGVPADWVPTSWWSSALNWKNPKNTYEWNILNSDGTTSMYCMEEWETKWYITLSAEPDGQPDPVARDDEWENRRYGPMQIWYEFDLQPTWYFEGAAETYFAIAKIQCSDLQVFGRDNNERVLPSSGTVRLNTSPGESDTIYLSQFGSGVAPSSNDFVSLEGKKLNPTFFRDKVYGYIELLDFGSSDWYENIWDLRGKGDAVTIGFTVTQFVVGEWKVQDVQDDTVKPVRPTKTGLWGWTGVDDFLDWAGTPTGQLWILFIVIAVTLIIIAIYAPQTFLIFGAIIRNVTSNSGGRKR